MGWFSAKNIAAVVAAPMTGGTSLLFADIPGRGSAMGELTGENSAKAANRENIKWQNYWNDKSIELANTAHQREVADLKAAGLNPILSAGGSGASTPGLTAPQVQNEMPGGYLEQANKFMGLMSAGAQASNLMTNSALQKAQTAQTNLDTAIKYDMAPSTIKMAEQNVANAIAQERLTNAQTSLTGKQQEKVVEETKRIRGGKLSEYGGTWLNDSKEDIEEAIKKYKLTKNPRDLNKALRKMGLKFLPFNYE